MPIYEFQCGKCSHAFELTRPLSKAGQAAKCPQCSARARRLYTATIMTTGGGETNFDSFDEDEEFGGGGGGGHEHGPGGHSHGPPDLGSFDDEDF